MYISFCLSSLWDVLHDHLRFSRFRKDENVKNNVFTHPFKPANQSLTILEEMWCLKPLILTFLAKVLQNITAICSKHISIIYIYYASIKKN